MEFDTNLRFKYITKIIVKSEKNLDDFVHQIWDIGLSKAAHIAQAGDAEIWLDYSDTLRTRHVSCITEETEEGYEVSFSAGTKASIFGDVIIMALILAIFWMMSKILVPSPNILYILGAIAAAIVAIGIAIYCGKPFGTQEVEELIKEIQKG